MGQYILTVPCDKSVWTSGMYQFIQLELDGGSEMRERIA